MGFSYLLASSLQNRAGKICIRLFFPHPIIFVYPSFHSHYTSTFFTLSLSFVSRNTPNIYPNWPIQANVLRKSARLPTTLWSWLVKNPFHPSPSPFPLCWTKKLICPLIEGKEGNGLVHLNLEGGRLGIKAEFFLN